MRKVLLVSGCSWTDQNFKSDIYRNLDTSWPKWPEILGNKLGMEVINLGQSGGGNEFIHGSLVDKIVSMDKDTIGLVMAAWTGSERRDWERPYFKIDKSGNKDISSYTWHNKACDVEGNVYYWARKSQRYAYSLQEICKLHNIKLKQFQMISPWPSTRAGFSDHKIGTKYQMSIELRQKNMEIFEDVSKEFIKSPYYNILDRASYINLSAIEDINCNYDHQIGFHCVNRSTSYKKHHDPAASESEKHHDPLSTEVGREDGHPNHNGHIKIAEYLYENL